MSINFFLSCLLITIGMQLSAADGKSNQPSFNTEEGWDLVEDVETEALIDKAKEESIKTENQEKELRLKKEQEEKETLQNILKQSEKEEIEKQKNIEKQIEEEQTQKALNISLEEEKKRKELEEKEKKELHEALKQSVEEKIKREKQIEQEEADLQNALKESEELAKQKKIEKIEKEQLKRAIERSKKEAERLNKLRSLAQEKLKTILIDSTKNIPLHFITKIPQTPLIPCGLTNRLKIFCYNNATIQALVSLPSFTKMVGTFECKHDKGALHRECLRTVLLPLIMHQNEKNNVIYPLDFQVFAANHIFQENGVGENKFFYQDAADFLKSLLDDFCDLHKEMKQLFETEIVEIKSCNQFKHIASLAETTNILALNLPDEKEVNPNNILSINDLITQFTAPEKLEGENRYACSTCKNKVDGTKQSIFSNLPEHLIIQLRRFGFNKKTLKTYKNRMPIRPIVSLDISNPADAKFEMKAEYELVAIVLHYGSLDSGHYTALAKRNNKWFYFDDETISDGNAILNELKNNGIYKTGEKVIFDPYILFYKKTS